MEDTARIRSGNGSWVGRPGGRLRSYTTPGRGADLSSVGLTQQARGGLSDPSVQDTLDRKPLAAFPTTIAVARLQAVGYRSCSTSGWGEGNCSIVTSRDVETYGKR